MLEDYTIRAYEPADREPFLDLYESVHGTVKTKAWFEWKYANNPFGEDLTMIVAEHAGQLVGARPLFALPMRCGSERFRARQPADAMVHAGHRRQGVFTRMLERTITRCEATDVDFLFTFPNELSGGAYEQLGWIDVGSISERYRPQRPLAILSADHPLPGVTAGLGEQLVEMSTLPARVGHHHTAGIRTELHQDTPIDELTTLYRKSVPDAFHAPRDEEFLEWRLRNPDWDYRTFLGYRDGTVTAAVVTAAGGWGGTTDLVRCVDVLPRKGGASRSATLEVLLRDVIAAYQDTSLFILPDGAVPDAVARRLGFLRSDRPAVDRLTESTRLFVTPLSDDAATGGVARRERWAPTFVEYDTA